MSEALALSFFDPGRQLYGTARSGATVLFEGRKAAALAEGARIEESAGGWRAGLPGRLALDAIAISEEASLGSVSARVCRVNGEVEGRVVDCLGTLSVTHEPPRWDELDALRSITALIDERHALLAFAQRPRDAAGHGQELVWAALMEDGELHEVEDARISTVYDGDGRQRSAGLELWLAGEEYSRRGSGQAIAGSSLDLDSIRVHVAVFRWRLEGREGTGAYELMTRAEPRAAA